MSKGFTFQQIAMLLLVIFTLTMVIILASGQFSTISESLNFFSDQNKEGVKTAKEVTEGNACKLTGGSCGNTENSLTCSGRIIKGDCGSLGSCCIGTWS